MPFRQTNRGVPDVAHQQDLTNHGPWTEAVVDNELYVEELRNGEDEDPALGGKRVESR